MSATKTMRDGVRVVSSRVVSTVEVTLTDGQRTWTQTMPVHGANGLQPEKPTKAGPKAPFGKQIRPSKISAPYKISAEEKRREEKVKAPWKGTLDGSHGGEIVSKYRAGRSMANIARDYSTSPACIFGVLKKRQALGEVAIRPRKGAPITLDDPLEKLHADVMGE